MAFQTGTRVDPSLGALDFSGFTNAAEIQGAALQDLGNRVGDAIGKSKEKKQKKELVSGISGLLKNQPQIAASLGLDSITAEGGDYDTAAKSVVDILGLKTGQALYGTILSSGLQGEEEDLISIKTQQDLKDYISEQDDYRIKDGQLINRRTNEVVGLGSKDSILKLEGVSDFLNLSKNPLGVED